MEGISDKNSERNGTPMQETDECNKKNDICGVSVDEIQNIIECDNLRYDTVANVIDSNITDKSASGNPDDVLCWNLPQTGSLPPIKDIQPHLFSQRNPVMSSQLVNGSDSNLVDKDASSVCVFSAANDLNLQRHVSNSVSTNGGDHSSSDFVYNSANKDNQMKYMTVLYCDSTDDLPIGSCSIPGLTDSTIHLKDSLTLNNETTETSSSHDSLMKGVISDSDDVSLDDLSQVKTNSTYISLLSKFPSLNPMTLSSVALANVSGLQNLLGVDDPNDHSVINITESNEHANIVKNTAEANMFNENASQEQGVLKIPKFVKSSTCSSTKLTTQSNNHVYASDTSTAAVGSLVNSSTLLPNISHLIMPSGKQNCTSQNSASNIVIQSPSGQSLANTMIVPSIKSIISSLGQTGDNFISSSTSAAANSVSAVGTSKTVTEVSRTNAVVEQITCQKCSLCSFISLQKHDVEDHIRLVHGTVFPPSSALNSSPTVCTATNTYQALSSSSNPITYSVSSSAQQTEWNASLTSPCSNLFSQVNVSTSEQNVSETQDKDVETSVSGTVTSMPNLKPHVATHSVRATNKQISDPIVVPNSFLNTAVLVSLIPAVDSTMPKSVSFTKDSIVNNNTTTANISLVNAKYSCSHCNDSFSALSELNSHILNKHNEIALKKNATTFFVVASAPSSQAQNQCRPDKNLSLAAADISQKIKRNKKNCQPRKALSPSLKKSKISSNTSETPVELRKRYKICNKVKADGTFLCDFKRCNASFRTEANLSYHKKCHILEQNCNGFSCTECGAKFIHWRNMATHLWKVHLIDMELYKCEYCEYKTWSLSQLLSTHKLIHGEDRHFLCDICGKGFKTNKQMRNHKVIHTNKKRKRAAGVSQSCDICSKVFSHKRMLQLHKEAVHDKIRPYLCNFCGYCASNRSTLKMHLRLHTGEKPYSCDICDYKTSDHNSLRRHKMRHSGEKPYKCPYCHYACIQSNTYKTHLKRKHIGLEEGLMYSCSYCSFKTIRQSTLDSHVSDHRNGIIPINASSFTTGVVDFSVNDNPIVVADDDDGESMSITLLPGKDGTLTLSAKGKPSEVINLAQIQIPESEVMDGSSVIDDNISSMVASNLTTPIALSNLSTSITLSDAAAAALNPILTSSLGLIKYESEHAINEAVTSELNGPIY